MRWILLAALLAAGTVALGSATGSRPHASPRVLFEDDFDGDRLDGGRWRTCHWWAARGCTIATNSELEWYVPGQVRLRDGLVGLVAERGRAPGGDDRHRFRSGMISTGPGPETPPRFAFRYGRATMRARLPAGDGLWPAFWLLPADRQSEPEIDVLEVTSDAPRTLTSHLHFRANGTEQSRGHAWPRLTPGFHTFAIDWRPGRLEWFVDGTRIWRLRGPMVPSEPMYLIANLAVSGDPPPSARHAVAGPDGHRLGQGDAVTSRLAAPVLERIRLPLYRNGYALVAGSALTSALGLVFWLIAAHAYPAAELGRSAALLSAMTADCGTGPAQPQERAEPVPAALGATTGGPSSLRAYGVVRGPRGHRGGRLRAGGRRDVPGARAAALRPLARDLVRASHRRLDDVRPAGCGARRHPPDHARSGQQSRLRARQTGAARHRRRGGADGRRVPGLDDPDHPRGGRGQRARPLPPPSHRMRARRGPLSSRRRCAGSPATWPSTASRTDSGR